MHAACSWRGIRPAGPHPAVTVAHRGGTPEPDAALLCVDRVPRLDPPLPDETERCAAAVRGALPEEEAEVAVGVAGTVTTVAALDLGLVEYEPERVHGHVVARASYGGRVREVEDRFLVPDRAHRAVPGRDVQ